MTQRISINKLYDIWAENYDKEKNLTMFLEEKITKKWLDFSGKNVLDLGCGTGRYSLPLSEKNQVTAIDFNKKMLKIAAKKAENNKNIKFILADVTKYKPKEKFDVIISMLVHDHIKKLKDALKVIDKAGKIGTKVIISNIHPRFTWISHIKGDKAQLVKGFITDEYYHPLDEYLEIFSKMGFQLVDYKDIIFKEEYAKDINFPDKEQLINEFLGVIYKFVKIK